MQRTCRRAFLLMCLFSGCTELNSAPRDAAVSDRSTGPVGSGGADGMTGGHGGSGASPASGGMSASGGHAGIDGSIGGGGGLGTGGAVQAGGGSGGPMAGSGGAPASGGRGGTGGVSASGGATASGTGGTSMVSATGGAGSGGTSPPATGGATGTGGAAPMNALVVSAAGNRTCPTVAGAPITTLAPAVVEGDSTSQGQFCVSLKYPPLSDTVVTLRASAGDAPITVTPTLTFSASSGVAGGYDRPQLATLSAGADDNTENEMGRAIVLSAPEFAPQNLSFNTVDNDKQAILVCSDASNCEGSLVNAINLNEGLQTTLYARLKFAPHVDTSEAVNVISNESGRVSVSNLTLYFNEISGGTNWKTPHHFDVLSTPDPDAASNTVVIRFSTQLTGGTWQASDKEISVMVLDGQTQAILLSGLDAGSPNRKTIDEGNSGAVRLRLLADPIETVTLTCSVASTAGNVSLAASGVSIFTPGAAGNWGTDHEMAINVGQDMNMTNEVVAVNCVTINGMPRVPMASFSVNVTDND